MANYIVTFTQTITYSTIVQAKSFREAERLVQEGDFENSIPYTGEPTICIRSIKKVI